MHKNIIFDCGRVLLNWEPFEIAKLYTDNMEDAKLFHDVVFSNWGTIIDCGDFEKEELSLILAPYLPAHLLPKVDELTNNLFKHLIPIDGMVDIVKELKEKGHKIYLLSNIHQGFDKHFNEFEVFKYFDGAVISGNIHMVKPYKGIYEHILNKFNLDPKECIFIDDNNANIFQAKKMGIDGYLFDPNKVKDFKQFLIDTEEI